VGSEDRALFNCSDHEAGKKTWCVPLSNRFKFYSKHNDASKLIHAVQSPLSNFKNMCVRVNFKLIQASFRSAGVELHSPVPSSFRQKMRIRDRTQLKTNHRLGFHNKLVLIQIIIKLPSLQCENFLK
jgi:hypothetical protein